MVVKDDMVCVLVNESGRDAWACRLTGRSQHPLGRNYSEMHKTCQPRLPGDRRDVIVFVSEIIISPAKPKESEAVRCTSILSTGTCTTTSSLATSTPRT